jgi:hypothetical protein
VVVGQEELVDMAAAATSVVKMVEGGWMWWWRRRQPRWWRWMRWVRRRCRVWWWWWRWWGEWEKGGREEVAAARSDGAMGARWWDGEHEEGDGGLDLATTLWPLQTRRG